MSVLGTTKHSCAISVLTLGNKVILYCKCIVPEETVQGHSAPIPCSVSQFEHGACEVSV